MLLDVDNFWYTVYICVILITFNYIIIHLHAEMHHNTCIMYNLEIFSPTPMAKLRYHTASTAEIFVARPGPSRHPPRVWRNVDWCACSASVGLGRKRHLETLPLLRQILQRRLVTQMEAQCHDCDCGCHSVYGSENWKNESVDKNHGNKLSIHKESYQKNTHTYHRATSGCSICTHNMHVMHDSTNIDILSSWMVSSLHAERGTVSAATCTSQGPVRARAQSGSSFNL